MNTNCENNLLKAFSKMVLKIHCKISWDIKTNEAVLIKAAVI
jgi:hypothetical protein